MVQFLPLYSVPSKSTSRCRLLSGVSVYIALLLPCCISTSTLFMENVEFSTRAIAPLQCKLPFAVGKSAGFKRGHRCYEVTRRNHPLEWVRRQASIRIYAACTDSLSISS